MITGYLNGHKVYWDKEYWCYMDGEIADKFRECPKCGKLPSPEGHDACLANLPGVKNACCGHGVEDGYLEFTDGTCIRFKLTSIERNL